jgi:hypothetical protein
MAGEEDFYRAAERRIEGLTLGLGTMVALAAAIRYGWRAASGLAVGAALAWVNYRWLKQAVDVAARLSAGQAEASKIRIPKRVYAKFFGRFALLLAAAYAILSRSWLPAAAILAGLFTLVAAVLVELIYELLRGGRQPDASRSR